MYIQLSQVMGCHRCGYLHLLTVLRPDIRLAILWHLHDAAGLCMQVEKSRLTIRVTSMSKDSVTRDINKQGGDSFACMSRFACRGRLLLLGCFAC
jgi:hypothetical protein